ncbi:ParB/RepB/Spo0J family partition protein [Glutamicibacter sp. FBE19]|uniref:ParB/RepB/Spo0J family partition protein n=1 Tax=Glutamicibacter sp. FBE19 TaxID=2761534 RepID=UPI00189678FD|nr:ParB/RepB/Spo0J family partition protein [Glutamicibacter sp. FBE19]MBF6671153.1 ParB/RepB/Spo0J family partition protein [Glutamicibacter sp. FBE19]
MSKLEMIDPTTLAVDTNVRKQAELGVEFIDSIREHGVLEPVIAHHTENGLKVLMGQRRTLASVEAECASIPVIIVDTPEEADRISQQVIENDMRTELSMSDRADAYQQLSLLGMTPAKIAKRTGSKAADVKSALKASKSKSGQNALGDGIPFDQAALIAEFEDYPDLVENLTNTAMDPALSFEHAAQKARSEVETRLKIAELTKELEAEGKTVVDDGMPCYRLNRADGTNAEEEDATGFKIDIRYYDGSLNVTPVVVDWEENGYTVRTYGQERAKGPMTDDEKAERKQLIERNKAMDDATEVRKKFLVTLLQQKTLPKGWESFVAKALCTHRYEAVRAEMHLVAEILGLTGKSSSFDHGVGAETGKSAKRAHQVMLATSLATYEKLIVRDCWRSTTGVNASMRADYLSYLQSWGYVLSEVEGIVAGDAN